MTDKIVGISLACEHTVWLKPPLPLSAREELWCVKCQCHVPIGGRHTQRTYFEDWVLIPTRRGYQGICIRCEDSVIMWDFYRLRTNRESHFIEEHVTGHLADALRRVKRVKIPKGKDLPPPF